MLCKETGRTTGNELTVPGGYCSGRALQRNWQKGYFQTKWVVVCLGRRFSWMVLEHDAFGDSVHMSISSKLSELDKISDKIFYVAPHVYDNEHKSPNRLRSVFVMGPVWDFHCALGLIPFVHFPIKFILGRHAEVLSTFVLYAGYSKLIEVGYFYFV